MEYKFRAFDSEQKRIFPVYGFDIDNVYEDTLDDYTRSVHPRNVCDVMMYTGLKDIKGAEIYEGDRVKVYWLAELGITELDCEEVGTVKFIDCRFIVEFDTAYKRTVMDDGFYEAEYMELTEASYEDECSLEFTVIGNIHEIPPTM